jgi:hypothetical protein
MLRRVTQVTVVAFVLAVVFGAFPNPTAAITDNYVEDFEHPFVGLVVFYDASGEFVHRCSGSLLTPIVFLTAGHCVVDEDNQLLSSARVYFQQDAGANYDPVTEVDPISGYPETCAGDTLGKVCATSDELYNYGFVGLTLPDTHDLGLVILDQPITLSEYGALAGASTLDPLATRRGQHDVTFTNSGYGVTNPNPNHTLSFRERLMSTAQLINLRSALTDGYNLQLSNNPGGGKGGTCGGDSGGPVFLGDPTSNLIVSVTSFGSSSCTGVDYSYRVDTEAALDWIVTTVAENVSPAEAGKIVIVYPSTPTVAAAAPTADAKDKKSGKDTSHRHGKAKATKHKPGKAK